MSHSARVGIIIYYLFHMSSILKKSVSGILTGLLVVSFLSPALSALGDTNSAVAYLKTKTVNPWVAMALASAGQTVDVSSLKTVTGDKATDYEAAILGLTANGKDPRTYPATDFIAKLKTFYANDQIGDASIINDDIFGILALVSAGVTQTDTVVSGSKTYLLAHQNNDGGWSFASSGGSDTNTTAAAIMALLETGVAKTDQSITKAVAYLKTAQNIDGGFTYDPVSQWGTASDSSSTAWVLSAINRLGEGLSGWTKGGKTPTDYLLSAQSADGYFPYQAGSSADSFTPNTTSYAVIALNGKYFPVAKFSSSVYPKVSYRIAGKNADLCEGDTFAPNPLELVKLVAVSCGFDYHLTETSFGPYLDRISSDTAGGVVGWLYNVNYAEPQVGAADYVLKANDAVLWHFDDFNNKLTRISLNKSEIDTAGSAVATVESFNGTIWSPFSGASVHFGNTLVSTDEAGHATLMPADGSYKVFATKDGYVRSEADPLIVGAKVIQDLNLSVTLPGSPAGGGGSSGNSSIAFTVAAPGDNATVGFGSIEKGKAYSKNLTIRNTGQFKIHLEASVTGDEVFKNYLTLGNSSWRSYADLIDQAGGKTIGVALNIPDTYPSGGTKTGKLTFWAITAN